MPRRLTLALAPLALVALGLTACTGTNGSNAEPAAAAFDTDHPVTIDFWHTFTGPLADSLAGIVDEFEASHPGITVNPVYQPYDTMLQSLQTSVAAGQPPALAQLELTSMAQLAALGALTPIPDLLPESDASALEDAIIPSIVDANSYDGTLYTVPFGYNSNVLYYNEDLVAAAGLTEDDLPTTWDELERVAPKLSDAADDVVGYGFPAQAPHILEVRFWQNGAELFGDDDKTATFDSPEGVGMFENYQDLVATGGARMVQTDSALNQLADLFAAGKVAMFEQSSTAMGGILGKATSFDVGVSAFPTMGDQVYSLGGYNLGVFEGAPTEQQRAAAIFADWWTTPEVAAEWTSVSNYMPGVNGAWDTDVLTAWQAEDPRRGVAAEQIANARPRPNLPAYPQIATKLADAFEATMSGQGSAQQNLDAAAQAADQILANG